MAASIAFNPYATISPANSFLLETQGLVQGVAYDDPSARMWLAEGVLASTETLPMWGGVPISEQINLTGTGAEGIGPLLARATAQGNVTGFSVYNQMNHMVVTPGATAPLAGSGNGVGFFRLKTNQRLAVQLDPALVAAVIAGGTDLINSQALYWDVTNYRVTLTTSGGNWALPVSVELLSINSNSKIVSYNSGTGAVTWTAGAAGVLLI